VELLAAPPLPPDVLRAMAELTASNVENV
jgi:hypothetical protein